MTHKIIGKYIKELKFNIPNPKTFFLLAKNIANYKINIDIKSVQVRQNIIEVLTSLKLLPVKGDFEKIDTKIIFSTIVEFSDEKLAKEEMEKNLKYEELVKHMKTYLRTGDWVDVFYGEHQEKRNYETFE